MAHSTTSTAINTATTGHHRSPTGHTTSLRCGKTQSRTDRCKERHTAEDSGHAMWGEGCPLRPWQPLWRRRSCRGILYGAPPATIRNKPPPSSAGTAETLRRRRKSHCALIRRSAQVLEGHAPWSCTGTWARRTRLAPSWSTTRTSPSASDVTCAQNNRVNSAKELVNRICSPPNVRKALGRG